MSDTRLACRFEQRGLLMNLVMNMVGKPLKTGEVIFDFGEKSDDLYLIHSGSVEIVPREGLVLAKARRGQLGVARARPQPDHPACRSQQDERGALAAPQ